MFGLECPENWLAEVCDGENLIDLIHTPSGRPVDASLLGRATCTATS